MNLPPRNYASLARAIRRDYRGDDMVAANLPDQKNIHLVSARLCSGCGKYFLHDHGYTLESNRKGPDGGPVVFHRRCYKGPETPVIDTEALATMNWKPLDPAKVS